MRSKFLYTPVLAIVLTMLSFCSASGQTTKEQPLPKDQTVKTIKIKVSGITCKGDVKDIQNSVTKMKGITACKAVGKPSASSMFEVSFNPAIVSEKEIQKAVEDTPGCENPDDRPYKVKQG